MVIFYVISLAAQTTSQPSQAPNMTLSASFPLEIIRPELFGLDLEFTRHDIWQGLSAELISNRLFALQPNGTSWPMPWPTGFPPRWTALTGGSIPSIGPGLSSSISCVLSSTLQLCGLVQLPVGNGFNSNMNFGSAIGLEEGKAYIFQILARVFNSINNTGLVLSINLSPSLFSVNFSVPDSGSANGDWTLLSYSFIAPVTTSRADSLTLSVQASQGTIEFNATSLLPVDNFRGMRSDVVDALQNLNFHGPLRYPGGCFAPFYNWKEGLLPLLSRPTTFTPPDYCDAVSGGVNAYSDGFMQNGLGIDDYIELTRRIGVEPAITFAIQYGTDIEIQDARDFVEYCNGDINTVWGSLRASRGYPEPYNVKMWYIGNEIDMQARYPDYPLQPNNRTGGVSPEEYQEILDKLIPVVRKVDLSIKLLVVYGNEAFNSPWITGDMASYISATSAHIAYENSNNGGSPSSAIDATSQSKLADTNVLPSLISVRQSLNSGTGSGSHVQVSIDEWGLGPPWDVLDFNVAHAQYGASFLTMIINNAQEQGLAYTNYFEPINEGALQVLQFSVTPTPLGVLMSIFGSLAGSTRLLLSTQTSTVINTDIIGVAAISKDSSDISSINVILTNRNASTSYSQMILIDGQTVATTASVTVLNATGFTTGSFFISETFSVPILSGWITVPIPPFSITTFSVVCLSC